jgi:hypothetical protein
VQPWQVLATVVIFVAGATTAVIATIRSRKSEAYKALILTLVGLAVAIVLPIFARPIEVAWDGFAATHESIAPHSSPANALEPTVAPQQGALTAATADRLSDDVQLSRFVDLLGAPLSQERLQNGDWLASTWKSPDIAVTSFSNRDSQVEAYTLTSLGPEFTPNVEYVRGSVRLRTSVFADVQDEPTGVSGVYPPNGRFSYEEFYLGGGATEGKSVVLAASYAANADDPASELLELQCVMYSIFEGSLGCSLEQLTTVRSGLHITSVTVGESTTLEALTEASALFFPAEYR